MMYEYACTCSNDMMNHYNQVGVQKWSDLIAYGISRDEFNTVEIDEIVNVILYAYQGIRKLTLDNDTFENTGKSRFFERRTSRVLY